MELNNPIFFSCLGGFFKKEHEGNEMKSQSFNRKRKVPIEQTLVDRAETMKYLETEKLNLQREDMKMRYNLEVRKLELQQQTLNLQIEDIKFKNKQVKIDHSLRQAELDLRIKKLEMFLNQPQTK